MLVLLLALACVKEETPEVPATASEARSEGPAAAVAGDTLVGTVIQKPWSKSVESWNAGGSDYYVLDVGGADVAHRSAEEGVILRPSEAVPAETLATFVGQKVEVTGRYSAGVVPKVDPMAQYPMDADRGPLPTGGGFQVLTIGPAK